jgi:hypothetical protein
VSTDVQFVILVRLVSIIVVVLQMLYPTRTEL